MKRLVVLEPNISRAGVTANSQPLVKALRHAWDAGDAVLILDPRLPPSTKKSLLEVARVSEPVEEDDALVVATSGSTGTPKAAVLTHSALMASARAVHARLGVDPLQDHWLACLPLSHVGGLGVVLRALLTDTPLTIHSRFNAGAVDEAARCGATLTSLVPTALGRLDPRRWRKILLGGAPAPGPTPPNVVRTYGSTESGGGVVYDGIPLDGIEVSLGSHDSGDPNCTSQIFLRGPTLLRAYRDGIDPKTRDGWLPTGDAGHFDDSGRLCVDGRLSELIISGGENVWPATVEAALRTHPQVGECAVAGRPDPEWGERVVAWVIPADPADPPHLTTLRSHVKATLPAYCAPRQLVLALELPRTRTGKVRPPAPVPSDSPA